MFDTVVKNNGVVFLLSALTSYLVYQFLRHRQQKQITVPRISKLIIYPIKSLQGIEVDHLDVVDTGVKWKQFHDREYVIINSHNNMITQRTKPKLSLVKPSFQEDGSIHIDAPGMNTLKLFPNQNTGQVLNFKVWEGETQGVVCSDEASEWFSSYLNLEARLVHFTNGLLQRRATPPNSEPSNSIVYQDGFPLLLINQASIDDLNSRMNREDHVTYRNFRPNFLIESNSAFFEDVCIDFTISGIKFKNVKLCTRCTMTTVIPDKGVKTQSQEPLKTLRKYRVKEELAHLYQDAPVFGINMIPINQGIIRIGDELLIC